MSKLQVILASVVTAVWVASIIARVLHLGTSSDFNVLDTVVLLVYGFIFSTGAIKKAMNGKGVEAVVPQSSLRPGSAADPSVVQILGKDNK
jgi:uncharacterized Tic20 family protein